MALACATIKCSYIQMKYTRYSNLGQNILGKSLKLIKSALQTCSEENRFWKYAANLQGRTPMPKCDFYKVVTSCSKRIFSLLKEGKKDFLKFLWRRKKQLTNIGFSMEYFTADFWQFWSTTNKVCLSGSRLSTCLSIPSISAISFRFPS